MCEKEALMTNEDALNLFFVIKIVKRYWIRILLYSLGGAVVAMVISFLLPKTYTAEMTILMPESELGTSALSTSLGFLNPNLSLSQGINSPTIKSILESDPALEMVVDRFNLVELYGVKYKDEAIKILRKRTQIGIFNLRGVIEIYVKDRDKKRAAEICNYYVKVLEELNKKLRLTVKKPVVRVISFAKPPLKKSFPKTSYNMITAFILVFIMTTVIYTFKEWQKE